MASLRDEFDFIARLQAQTRSDPRVPVGIGDDAALVRLPPLGECLVTVDMLMEGVDFLIPPATAEQVGRKSLAVNLSDLAACGAQPLVDVAQQSALLGRESVVDSDERQDEAGPCCQDQSGVHASIR